MTDFRGLEPPTEVDGKKKAGILLESFYQRMLGSLQREVDGKKQQLANVDLAKESGLLDAVRLQGEIAGMARFLDVLTEIPEEETTE